LDLLNDKKKKSALFGVGAALIWYCLGLPVPEWFKVLVPIF
jgi:hypothetical protein